jgi:hypothetical protein
MSSTAEPAFTPGQACVLTTVENSFPAIRHVEFLSHVDGGTQAQVRWGQQTFNVQLDQLSRLEPPQPPAFLGKWFTTPTAPIPPSEDQISERLGTARQALARSHERVKTVQAAVDQARAVVDRAAAEHAQATAALRSYDAAARSDQIKLEEALRLGRPTPSASNGHDHRHYVQNRTDQAQQALTKFQSELAAQMAAMNEALASIRKAAADIISLLVQRETEALRGLEIQAAIARAELISVSHWWPDAALGAIPLPRVTAAYLEQQPAWQDVTQVRLGGPEARQQPWKSLFAKLVNGDVQADFNLDQNE